MPPRTRSNNNNNNSNNDPALNHVHAISGLVSSPSRREGISQKNRDLITALTTHEGMRRMPPHPTLYMTWDFANRINYILSELENVRGGRRVTHPDQIPDYVPPFVPNTPDPVKALELMHDCWTRTLTLHMMINSPSRTPLAQMGLPDVPFSDEIKQKAQAVVDSFGLSDRVHDEFGGF